MINIQHNICIKERADFDIIYEIFKKQINIDKPVFMVNLYSSYSINFESDYEEYEMIRDIKASFPEYDCIDSIGLGKADVRIIISRVQDSFSSDGWGRPLESNDNKTFYFIIKAPESIETQPSSPHKTVKTLLGRAEEHEFNINVVSGRNRDTNQTGFIVIEDKMEECETKILSKTLYKTKNEAFWGEFSFRSMELQRKYEDYKASQKRKAKNKLSFENWMKSYSDK